mgnify:FL=1
MKINSIVEKMNPYDSILMIPGPTQLDEKVRKVMSEPQIGHSSE